MKPVLVLGLAAVALTITGCKKQSAAMPDGFVPGVTYELNCEDDGRLVERHVGIKYARQYDGAVWYIRYTDDQVAFYNQPVGETCFLIPESTRNLVKICDYSGCRYEEQ